MTSPIQSGFSLPPMKPVPTPLNLYGTSLADVLHGFGGDDVLFGFGGDDVLYGNDGANRIYAGSGHDQVYVGDGDNYVSLGSGDDTLEVGTGDNEVNGGSGNDYIRVGVELQWASYEIANKDGVLETVWYSYAREDAGGDNIVFGGSGDDTIVAYAGDDELHGGSGSDYLQGGRGDDKLWGDAGDDTLYSGQGADIMRGGQGDDVYYASVGDTINFGNYLDGNDRVRLDSWSDGAVGEIVCKGGDLGDVVLIYGGNYSLQQTGVGGEDMRYINYDLGVDVTFVGGSSVSFMIDDFGGKG